MKREEYIKKLITEQGYNVKEFAKKIDLPYSTLRSILSGSIGGASVDNAIKICHGLGIKIEDLQNVIGKEQKAEDSFQLSSLEKEVITCYRKKKDMQNAVNILLGIDQHKK